MEMEKPMMAVPRYRISTTHPAVVANNRELRRHLGKRKVFFVNDLLAHPRLVATTITLGLNRVERKMPEKRPARKLTQRVVVREAAWRRLSH